jgi:hypothetical protein
MLWPFCRLRHIRIAFQQHIAGPLNLSKRFDAASNGSVPEFVRNVEELLASNHWDSESGGSWGKHIEVLVQSIATMEEGQWPIRVLRITQSMYGHFISSTRMFL